MVWIALTFLSHSSDSVVKKTDFDEVAKKVNAIQTTNTSNLVKKAEYSTKLMKLKRKLLIMITVTGILIHIHLMS